MEIGLIGLGRMGGGIARRLLRRGIGVSGFDRDTAIGASLAPEGVRIAASVDALVDALAPPRVIWTMLPAGAATEEVVSGLADQLAPGDLVLDGGNGHYRDAVCRHRLLAERGIGFLDVGTSGGLRGEQHGYCLMIGGDAATIEALRPLFEALAPGPDQGWGRVGGVGAGHFAKMVHNGIEYGMMQSLAEGFALLDAKRDLELEPDRVAAIWRHGSVIRSWLLDLVAERLADPATFERIAPVVEDSGEGRWAVLEALELDVPLPVITASVLQRIRSRVSDSFADRILAALRQSFGGHSVAPRRGTKA